MSCTLLLSFGTRSSALEANATNWPSPLIDGQQALAVPWCPSLVVETSAVRGSAAAEVLALVADPAAVGVPIPANVGAIEGAGDALWVTAVATTGDARATVGSTIWMVGVGEGNR